MIYLDSCLLIYLVEQHPQFGAVVAERLNQTAKEAALASSDLGRLECLVQPRRADDFALTNRYEQVFKRLVVLPMPAEVFDMATTIRARTGLKTPDALHLACALHHQCSAFWTHDSRLAQAANGFALNILGS